MTPEISVIMSVYNGEDYLAEAIESVCRQTFPDWELIIINDCSKDGTAEILEQYARQEERIRVHTNEVNLRLPTSLNKAISLARGKYIARMDADDICLPDRLERQYRFMEENPSLALSSCRFLTLKNGVYASGGCGGRCDSEALKALLLVTNPILHPGIIAKADCMKQLQYDTTLTCTEDLELWTRFAMNGLSMQIQPEYLMVYRLHEKQITETTRARQQKEVALIEKTYYSALAEEMDEAKSVFYTNGIYFTDGLDVSRFCEFCRWLMGVNRRKRAVQKDALSYALFEILAEYKRRGISKKELLQAMCCFSPAFLAKELLNRKKRAREDGEKCINTAKKLGLVHSAGTVEFPIFSKSF